MGVLDREEINGFTKEQVDAAKESINANTDAEISAAIAALQTATGEARDAILAKLGSGGSSVIKSIQRGVIKIGTNSTAATATISSVNTAKAVVLFLGCVNNGSDSNIEAIKHAYLELTNGTTVTATRKSSSTTVFSEVSFEVVEFN